MTQNIIPATDLIKLTGKTAIVTGGAQGIGYAIAGRFSEAGANVFIVDINPDKAKEASNRLTGSGYKATATECDVTDETQVKKMTAKVAETAGSIDILVNNAGIFPRILLEKMTAADFNQVTNVNLTGVFLCSREASKYMIKQGKGGCIINISSIDGLHPSAHKGMLAYDTSKGGVWMMTKTLAHEMGIHDIRVNAIAPGGIVTEGVLSRLSNNDEEATKQEKANFKSFMGRMILGRMGRPDEIGRVALFLACDLSSYITGTLIVVDGGYLIS
jgi:2-dehydro-3-deoxy-D-gluconate 5-dehydrogenase